MDRRAQLISHIIVFVIGLVVIGLVFLFGYQVIQGVNQDRCEVRRLQFGTDLSSALDRNKNWGINTVTELQAPCETAQVCFVDRRVIDDPAGNPGYLGPITNTRIRTVINASVQTNTGPPGTGDQSNVFTISTEGEVRPVERYSDASAPIRVTAGGATADCVDIEQETLRVRMQGDGQTAEIISVGAGS